MGGRKNIKQEKNKGSGEVFSKVERILWPKETLGREKKT